MSTPVIYIHIFPLSINFLFLIMLKPPLKTIQENELEIEHIFSKENNKLTAKAKSTVDNKVYFYTKLESTQEAEVQLIRAVCSSLTLENSHLVTHYEVIINKKSNYYIFLSEFYSQGSLEDELKTRKRLKKPWPEEDLIKIWIGILKGFSYMEAQECFHRNIRPSNLIKASEKVYKITNFRKVYDLLNRPEIGPNFKVNYQRSLKIGLDFLYISPEFRKIFAEDMQYPTEESKMNEKNIDEPIIIEKNLEESKITGKILEDPNHQLHNPWESYDPLKADVYSLGIIFLEMCSFEILEHSRDTKELKRKTESRINKINYSQNIKNILNLMLNVDPKLRPTFCNLLRICIRNITSKINLKKESPKPLKKITSIQEEEKKSISDYIDMGNTSKFVMTPEIEPKITLKRLNTITRDEPIEKQKNKLIRNFNEIELNQIIHYVPNKDRKVEIYTCNIIETRVEVAAKVYTLSDRLVNVAESEKNIYKELSGNDAFLKFYGSFIYDNKYYIIIEKGFRSLRDYINDKSFTMSEGELRIFAHTLLEGFSHLQSKNIVHRDIKPENILLTENNLPKIIDFSSCYKIIGSYTPGIIEVNGTPNYTAPEVSNTKYSPKQRVLYDIVKADSFSLGLTLLEVFTKKATISLALDTKKNKLKKKIKKINYEWAKTIVKDLLERNPDDRPVISEVLLTLITSNTASRHVFDLE